MYVPEDFRLDYRALVAEVIGAYDFALLVTAPATTPGGRAQSSHLPFLYDPEDGPDGTLLAHMARANPQWRDFATLAEAGQEAMGVFQGPPSYNPHTWYGGGPHTVPNRNYDAGDD